MGIYLSRGYLNQQEIERLAERNNISFIIEIGGRQVGKTYGTLKLMLDTEKKFILMRRTQTETDFICNDINNPFTVFHKDIIVKRDTKYTARISINDIDHDEFIGSVMALSTIAKIRGFNGSIYSDLVFDEFIPENHVMKIRDEGDAFLNAVVTIAGNREIEGDKPLRVWLLANANTISSPILAALNVQSKIEDMMTKGQELSIMPERGIMIILPHSEHILSKRKKTALMRAIDNKSQFAEMAFDNKFAYNDASNICSMNLKEYSPIFSLSGKFAFFKHKSIEKFYVTKFRNTPNTYINSDRDISLLLKNYPNLKVWYIRGCIYFSDLITKTNFIEIIK